MAERRTVKPRNKKPTGPAGRGEPTVRKVTIEVIDPPPPSPQRGLLPTPPEVEEIVEGLFKERPAGPAYRLQTTENLKLQYYFGGYSIVYRDTPQGKEVLAVGEEETTRFYREVPYSKHKGAVLGYADPW